MWNKQQDRAYSERARRFTIAWNDGTFNVGRNKAKRERRARHFGVAWVNPRAMVARPTKAVRPAQNKRRRAMTAKARALRSAP